MPRTDRDAKDEGRDREMHRVTRDLESTGRWQTDRPEEWHGATRLTGTGEPGEPVAEKPARGSLKLVLWLLIAALLVLAVVLVAAKILILPL